MVAGLATWVASLSVVDILRSVALIAALGPRRLQTERERRCLDSGCYVADQIVNFAIGIGLGLITGACGLIVVLFPATLLGLGY